MVSLCSLCRRGPWFVGQHGKGRAHMHLIGRLGALVLGLIGAAFGLVVNFAYSAFHDIARWAGDTHMDSTHGFIGFFALVAGHIGSFIPPSPPFAAAGHPLTRVHRTILSVQVV